MNTKEPKKDQPIIILLTQGGAGDVIAQTPVVRYFRRTYPDDFIIALSTYPQIWENNPHVDKVVPLSDPHDFYEEYVMKSTVRFFKKRFIYDYLLESNHYALGAENILEFACRCFGAEYDGEGTDYYISDYEQRAAEVFMRQSDKGKILLHIYGAVPSDGGYGILVCGGCGGQGIGQDGNRCSVCGGSGKIVKRNKTNNLKDLSPEIVAPIVEKYKDKYDFLQIGLEGEPLVPGAFDCLGLPMRETIALIPRCASFIFIESLFAHAAGALKKSGVVVYQNTDPVFFNYPTAYVAGDPNGCSSWPCNRPVGALLDLLPGYKNPKTRERLLWECPDQKCAKISSEKLESVFIQSLDGPPRPAGDGGHATLEDARKAPPPKAKPKPPKPPKEPELEMVKEGATKIKEKGSPEHA